MDEPASSDSARARHAVYVQEIEGLDDHWGSTLRAVYERDEQHVFMQQLSGRIEEHDRCIERLCSHHYQHFIDSIRQLLLVRTDAARLKTHATHADRRLADACRQLVRRGDALARGRRVQLNIQRATAALRACLPLLATCTELRRHLDASVNCRSGGGRQYQALRTLQRLERALVPPVTQYRFATMLVESAARVRANIAAASVTQLKDFLEQARRQAPTLGRAVMQLHDTGPSDELPPLPDDEQEEYDDCDDCGDEGVTSQPSDVVKTTSQSADHVSSRRHDDSDMDEDQLCRRHVDFVPLYGCWLIQRTLGETDQFRGYYRMQRGKQARLASDATLLPTATPSSGEVVVSGSGEAATAGSSACDAVTALFQLLHGMSGFFAIERHVMLHAGHQLVDGRQLQLLWSEATAALVRQVHVATTAAADDAASLLAIKQQLAAYCRTATASGGDCCDVRPLQQVLLDMRQPYNHQLMRRCERALQNIFSTDNYHPIELPPDATPAVDHSPVVRRFLTATDGGDELPHRLSYSLMVPRVYRQLVLFVRRCARFCTGLGLTCVETDEWLRRSLNQLLTVSLASCVAAEVRRRPALGLLQLIQISINTAHLETASQWLEQEIAAVTGFKRSQNAGAARVGVAAGASAGSDVQSCLMGGATFKDMRADTEQHIYSRLQAKIDESLELASYNWQLAEPTGAASSYMLDMVYFLRSTFDAFTNLPPAVAQTACMCGCQHVARRLLALVTGPASATAGGGAAGSGGTGAVVPAAVSLGALQQLSLDVLQCEQFAASEPVAGFEDGALLLCFAELRQLLDLAVHGDWQCYASEYGQAAARYGRVTPTVAAALVDKLRETDGRNVFTVLKKAERDRRRQYDAVIKQLRQLELDASATSTPAAAGGDGVPL